jgi:hypothetical protein
MPLVEYSYYTGFSTLDVIASISVQPADPMIVEGRRHSKSPFLCCQFCLGTIRLGSVITTEVPSLAHSREGVIYALVFWTAKRI